MFTIPGKKSLLYNRPQIQSREQLVTPINNTVIITPGGTSCLTSQYCICRVQHYIRPLVLFSPHNSQHSIFNHHKVSQHGEFSGQFKTDSSFLCNQSVWCLQQWVLPSNYGVEPTAITIACTTWDVSGTSLSNNLQGGNLLK